jgi:RimJ/RimL family protein N-acetyltransferase
MVNFKNKKIKIDGERIYLKSLVIKNATKEYCRWLNDPEVNKYLETRHATIGEIKKYIIEKNKSSNCLFLGIFVKKNKKHIGNVKLEPICFKTHKATFGILIGDKMCWGKGIGTDATKLIIDYGFKKLGLSKIDLGVISENVGAIKAYKKTGFKIDKIVKKSICHGEKMFDAITMSIKKTN